MLHIKGFHSNKRGEWGLLQSRMAQRQRVGLITQRSVDRNHLLLEFLHSLTVRIWPFQGRGRGSIPRAGKSFHSSVG
jgi:hypothetical protein